MLRNACLFLVVLACAYCATVPKWTPTYDMAMSTVFMPCNYSGYFDAKFAAQFGIADFDWSNAKQLWANTKPMTCEEYLVEQANRVKAINPKTKVFVYRNLVKALPRFSNVRTKITDKEYEGWFMKFSGKNNYHVSQCDDNYNPPKCSDFYHDDTKSPQRGNGDNGQCVDACDCGSVPCGEYLWDHRNTSVADYLIKEVILGNTALGNEHISGFYLDDFWQDHPSSAGKPWCNHYKFGGASEENYYCVADMGLDQEDVTNMYTHWRATIDKVYDAITENGGWSFQQFTTFKTPEKEQCAKTFRAECSNDSVAYTNAIHYSYTLNGRAVSPLPQFEQDLAGFLLVRGPYAWLGYGWSGCSVSSEPPGAGGKPYMFPDELKLDYGVPTEICHETEKNSGIFVRKWSKSTVQFDCNTYTGSVKFTN